MQNLADRFYLSVLDVYTGSVCHFPLCTSFFGMSFVPKLPKLSGYSSHPSFSFRLVFHCLVPSMLSDHIVNRHSLVPGTSSFTTCITHHWSMLLLQSVFICWLLLPVGSQLYNLVHEFQKACIYIYNWSSKFTKHLKDLFMLTCYNFQFRPWSLLLTHVLLLPGST